jgi:hypothetical protein
MAHTNRVGCSMTGWSPPSPRRPPRPAAHISPVIYRDACANPARESLTRPPRGGQAANAVELHSMRSGHLGHPIVGARLGRTASVRRAVLATLASLVGAGVGARLIQMLTRIRDRRWLDVASGTRREATRTNVALAFDRMVPPQPAATRAPSRRSRHDARPRSRTGRRSRFWSSAEPPRAARACALRPALRHCAGVDRAP